MQTIMIRTIGMVLSVLIVVPTLKAQKSNSASEDVDPVLAMHNQMSDVDSEEVQETITGQVIDAQTGEAIPGVNFVVQGAEEVIGATVGTTTNIDGEYTIDIPEGLNTFEFTFIGYVRQTIQIDGRTEINVELMQDIQLLDDVVVVGYGVQEERDVTGVVTSVDSDKFNRGVDASPDRLIAGKVSGVQITSSSGEPGAQSMIRIRGGTSITASNEPLFVIDGVPIDNSPVNARNPLNFLNTADIENITVLKDASATAIYGSRGANGVILIQTKQGDAGLHNNFSYSGKTSISRIAQKRKY